MKQSTRCHLMLNRPHSAKLENFLNMKKNECYSDDSATFCSSGAITDDAKSTMSEEFSLVKDEDSTVTITEELRKAYFLERRFLSAKCSEEDDESMVCIKDYLPSRFKNESELGSRQKPHDSYACKKNMKKQKMRSIHFVQDALDENRENDACKGGTLSKRIASIAKSAPKTKSKILKTTI